MILPDFFIIGAQKCGTTSMWRILTTHPSIDRTEKEKNFFVGDNYKEINLYSEKFRDPKKINGDASNTYLFYNLVPKRIKEFLPNAKFIVSLRNPIDRAYSQYHHELNTYKNRFHLFKKFYSIYNKVPTFEEALQIERKLKNRKLILTGNVEENWQYYFSHTFVQRGYYADQLKNWFNYFSKNQFLIINFEDFIKIVEIYHVTVIRIQMFKNNTILI